MKFEKLWESKIESSKKFRIPEDEIIWKFSRSDSGAGGRKKDATASKVQLFWNIYSSKSLPEEDKKRITEKLAHRITKDGCLIVTAHGERSQSLNRKIAFEKLNQLVEEVLKPEKERIPTQPPLYVKERRLEEKKRISEKKKGRRKTKFHQF